MKALRVLSDGLWMGTLSVSEGRWSFEYAPQWSAHPLAPRFPLQVRSYQDQGELRQVEWFFENLLPEGRLRELIAFRDRIDTRDSWALLARHGQDTAGALSLVAFNSNEDTCTDARQEVLLPLSQADLQAKIFESRRRNLPLMASWEEIRMSLAGAQEKLGIRIESDGTMFLPEGAAASTHIVKPENTSADFPFCPANEFFCMRLASELKLPVPQVSLIHLPEPLYIIERFDRVKVQSDSTIKRLHQVDMCQALGVPPSLKYESDGGLGLHNLFELLAGPFINRPAVAVNAIIQWVAFNYLIGNLDAHAKNIAFLLRGQKAEVAPFYDMLCVEAYLPHALMSMSIAGENKPGWIEGIHWDAMAYEAKVAPRLVRDMLSRMSAALPDAISKVIGDDRLLVGERDFIQTKLIPVIAARQRFLADALKLPRSGLADLLNSRVLSVEVVDRLKRVATSAKDQTS